MPADRPNLFGFTALSRSTVRFVAPVLVSIAVMCLGAAISLELLSTIRAYVGGEGLYSKGQQNATYYLAQYAESHSEDDYRRYEAAIAFPLGDWRARLALQHRPIDWNAARKGLLAAGNHPADVDSIILLFRVFGTFGPVRKAIDIWREGDGYTLRLCALATRLHSADGAELTAQERTRIRSELNQINRELTPLAQRFSSTLSELARTARTFLVLALVAGALTTGYLCLRVTRARVAERLVKERRLARVSELYAALTRASQLVSRVDNRADLFTEICRICVSTSGLNVAAVALMKSDRVAFEFSAPEDLQQECLKHLETAEPRDHDAGLHWTFRTGDSTVLHHDEMTEDLFRSEAFFPLRCQNQVVGVLCVFSRERQYFRSDIVELMDQLATEVSSALDSLHRESERRHHASILEDQNRILHLIASGAELEATFANLVQLVEEQVKGAQCSLAALEGTSGGGIRSRRRALLTP